MLLIAPVCKRYYRDATTRHEDATHFYILGMHQFHEVLHYYIDAILVKIAMITEAEEIKFETFALHHIHGRNIVDNYTAKIRLSGLRAQRGEFRAGECDKIFVLWMLVWKRLEHLGSVVGGILHAGCAEKSTFFYLAVGS